ncbi:response regulator [Pseudanabaena sp. Chao 1811]|uniref:response regulator n=1 Tax=Pseudanabaena sp. Chao 1811 TaxID=2963092 RepID=UPI0022F3E7C2|nr:response regulator [Pseudanabaena sp. Chao 1811]
MNKSLNSPWEDLSHPVILIVEDSDEDFYMFMRAIQNMDEIDRSPYRFLRFHDGDETLDYLFRAGAYQELNAPLPVAILLDLNLPGTDGREVIQQVKQSPNLKTIPIIVLTTSNSHRDIQTCYEYGANCYVIKPMGVALMQQAIQNIFKYWFQIVVLPSYEQFTAKNL